MARTLLAVLLFIWPNPAIAADGSAELAALKRRVIADYAALARVSYEDALDGARLLANAIDAFLTTPSADSLKLARQAWIGARVPYAQTEAFRFYDGPIDVVEGLVNAWPIDENLIDYIEGEPDAGIVNAVETYAAITDDLVVSLNEKGGEKNITAGFHAIEFLLWGQDLSDGGPGNRPFVDFADDGSVRKSRRREYLRVATRLLVENLKSVADEWAANDPTNYRARFVALPPDKALASMLEGIGMLSGAELAGERLTVPYETKEQEDEHSCFSDNTQQDILYNAVGIENIVWGRYVRIDGRRLEFHGLRELLSRVAPAIGDALGRQVSETVAAARAVPAPFDRAIVGADSAPSRVAVKTLIIALRAQADSIAKAGAALGLKLSL